MAYDKVVDSATLDANLTAIADACRRVKTKAQYNDLIDQAVISRHVTITMEELLKDCDHIGAKCFMNTDLSGEIVIPEGIQYIQYEAFQERKITKLTLPKSLKYLEDYVFYGTYIKSATFQSTPTSVPSNVLLSCYHLTDIYVPWSEGEVANAPWGATNATIHYNCEVV